MSQEDRGPSQDSSTEQFTEMEWIKFLGIEPLEASDGRAVIRLDPQSVHLNHNGTINAPVLFALGEVAGAGAVVAGMLELAASSYTVIKSASIDFVAPARGAVTATGQIPIKTFAEARASVEFGQPAEVDVSVEVTDNAGTLVSRSMYVVAVRPRRSTK